MYSHLINQLQKRAARGNTDFGTVLRIFMSYVNSLLFATNCLSKIWEGDSAYAYLIHFYVLNVICHIGIID